MKNVPWIFLGLVVGCGGGGGGDAPSSHNEAALISGSLVPAFGGSGVATSDPSNFYDEIIDMKADAQALYLAGTYELSEGDAGWRIEKRDRFTGALLAAADSNPSDLSEYPQAMAVDATYLYVVGGDRGTAQTDSQWRIEKRRLSDLSLVDGFGVGGVVRLNVSSGEDQARAVAVDSQYLYVTGHRVVGDNDGWRFARLRLDTGLQDLFTTSNPTAQIDRARAMAIDGTHMYVVGTEGIGPLADGRWRIEKRRLSNFLLDPAFGVAGAVSANLSPRSDIPNAIAVDGTYMIVVGSQGSGLAESSQWRVEKRLLSNGALDPAFGVAGAVLLDFSVQNDFASTVALDGVFLYVGGEDNGPGNPQWRIEKRYLTDASRVDPFGAHGVVVSDPTSGDDWLAKLLLSGGDLYLAGMDAAGEGRWRMERRVP